MRSHERETERKTPSREKSVRAGDRQSNVQMLAAAARGRVLNGNAVVELQRVAGNGAVASLLSDREAGQREVQRAPEAEAKPAESARTTYAGSNFAGKAVTADAEFVDSLTAINAHAVANNVNLLVTSSLRQSTVVPGAIVTPAKMSNHLVGHAIDMNVMYGPKKDKICNSKGLSAALPTGVKGFIEAVQQDAGLRWGGDFKTRDPVHIDDGLNVTDPEAYKARLQAMRPAPASDGK